jgi:hypothetical protein
MKHAPSHWMKKAQRRGELVKSLSTTPTEDAVTKACRILSQTDSFEALLKLWPRIRASVLVEDVLKIEAHYQERKKNLLLLERKD